MNIEKALLEEHSKSQTLKVSNYIGTNTTRFEELLQLFFEGNKQLNQRAAAVVNYLGEHHQKMITPYLPQLVSNLHRKNLHDAVKRNTVRLLQLIEFPEELYGEVADICFGYLASQTEPIAVKAFSITVLEKICQKHPELKNELRILIEDQMPYGSAGFKNRGKKTLKIL